MQPGSMAESRNGKPVHDPSASLTGTSLQLPPAHFHQPSHSQLTTPTDPSLKSRSTTRQSHLSSASLDTSWTSVSALSANSSSIKPSLYPTSGYPLTGDILASSYPGTGYPVSHLQHSYGYPSSNFPCCQVPGMADLSSQVRYPSSDFPGGGAFPGEFEDDGSHPYIGAFESGIYPAQSGAYPQSDPLGYLSAQGGGLPPGPTGYGPIVDTVRVPGVFDPNYNAGYH